MSADLPIPEDPRHSKAGSGGLVEAKTRLWEALCRDPFCVAEFQTQYRVGGYLVDFCSPMQKLIIEVDDPKILTHDEFYITRNAWLGAEGWRLLRFTSHDVQVNMEGVLSVIRSAIHPG